LGDAAVEFFESYKEEPVYVTTFGYKSYVPWFYAGIQPHKNSRAIEKEWLYHGNTDLPVLISAKLKRVERLEKEIPDAVFLYHKNGFYFYKRPKSTK
jgi:hypothetical protein